MPATMPRDPGAAGRRQVGWYLRARDRDVEALLDQAQARSLAGHVAGAGPAA